MEKISRDNFYQQIAFGLLALAAATVTFTRFLMLPIAILLLLLYVADNRYSTHFQSIRKHHLSIPFGITLSLFLLCMVGTAYSANIPKAVSDWECKLWFLVAPLCLLPLTGKISLKRIHILLIVFCLSATATAIGNIVTSTANFSQSGDTGQFFYMNAGHFFWLKPTHPSYLSMYCAIAWVISIILLTGKKKELPKGVFAALIAAAVILPAEIILLQSKAGVMLFAIVFLCTLYTVVRRSKLPRWVGPVLLVLSAALCAAATHLDLLPVNRLGTLRQHLQADERANPYNGSLQRIAVWETACEAASDHLPFGTGTGDISDELCQRYEQKGYTYILDKRLNCHNQYLQHLVGLGIPGILALLLFIGIPLWEGIRKKDFLLGIWGVLVAGNLLVESMLETRAGSNFIPMMTMLLLMHERAHAVNGSMDTE